jgi:SAM-dependent methyltransferase
MLQVSDISPRFLVLSSESTLPGPLHHYFSARGEGLGPATLYRSIDSFDAGPNQIDRDLCAQEYIRVFEHFWIPRQASGDTRKLMVRSLFSAIAGNYDSIVTSEHNVHCYEHLYSLAKKRLYYTPNRVLDFGCGTGLITQTKIVNEARILKGFDFCPKMASIAQKRGLDVLEGAVQALEEGSFDLVLASYVFHYGLGRDDWTALLSCVGDRGAIFGNFHKGIGLPQAIEILESLKTRCTFEIKESDFGPVLTVIVGTKDVSSC